MDIIFSGWKVERFKEMNNFADITGAPAYASDELIARDLYPHSLQRILNCETNLNAMRKLVARVCGLYFFLSLQLKRF